MTIARFMLVVGGIAAVVVGAHAADKNKPTGTLKDLVGRKVEVAPQAASGVTPEQAAAAYRRFLELQNASPQLRVEAMRRLGDLNIEANENALAGSASETLDSK